jgi:signal transduction histidine kinase/HAMP domain-containing protein
VSLKARQVAGVTAIVGLVVIILSLIQVAALGRVRLEESQARGEALSHAIFQQAYKVGQLGDLHEGLRTDSGIRSLLESSIAYSKNVTYAAIVDSSGKVIAHSFPSQEGNHLVPQDRLDDLLSRSAVAQMRAIYSDRTFEVRQPLLLGTEDFGSIRIGLSTLLIQDDLSKALRPAILTALTALLIAMVCAMLLSHWLLRPIHVIKAGLSRLGRGEFDVKLDLPSDEEFGELGTSFNSISAQLAAVGNRVGETANLKSLVEHLEDAVALFSPDGALLFANPAMVPLIGTDESGRRIDDLVPRPHLCRRLIERTLATGQPQGPVSGPLSGVEDDRLFMTHPVLGPDGQPLGVVLLARNLGYLTRMESQLKVSHRLAALGGLLTGVAHEVKNPLNAMTIHLELLKQKLSSAAGARARLGRPAAVALVPAGEAAGARLLDAPAGLVTDASAGAMSNPAPPPADVPAAMKHVGIIADEIKRLDRVIQGFLKFTRPAELKLQPIQIASLIDDVIHVIEPEARGTGVTIRQQCPADAPSISGDPEMLHQALLNLSLNACQAMPNGGHLTFSCRADGDRVELAVTDSGNGIKPEHLEKIFDLYFTTKESGSGIGLSMVYRTIQLHDGEIEVESTPAHGTTFRLLFPRANPGA